MNESGPVISVIIPVYNMGLYLDRCLNSVLSNTYRNLEVICVDDGSTDDSLETLRRYENADPRVVVIAKENGGVSSARNAGLERMTGKYVTFVDSDDYIHPQYIEMLYRALQETGASISICGFMTVDTDENDKMTKSYTFDSSAVHEYPLIQIFKTQKLRAYCWGKLIGYDLVKDIQFCEELKLAEDTAFFAEVFEKGEVNGAAVISYPLYCYFQREGSAVKVANTAQLLQFGRVWCQRLHTSDRDDIYLDKALKWYLSIRYQAVHLFPDRETVRECNLQLMDIRCYLRNTTIYGSAEKAAFLSFIYFPSIYRFHRILGDPSMRKWEKIERKKRLEEKRNSKGKVRHNR